ncbi:MAG: c-type cytochrome [Polyangiales bacterium]
MNRLAPRPFLMLLAALFALAPLQGCRRVRARLHRRTVRAEVRRGHRVYDRYCALCHGRDLKGYAADHANALGNRDFLAVASDQFLRDAIANGRPGTPMSPWSTSAGGPLDAKQIDDLVAFLRSRGRYRPERLDETPLTGDLESARAVWAQRCQTCHGERGQGSERATSVSHPNFLRVVTPGFLRATIRHGRAGTQMQGFGDLSPQTVDGLVAHIHTLSFNPGPPPEPEFEPPPTLEHAVIHPEGRAPSFTLREGRFVPADQVMRALADGRRMIILDARATSDWNRGHIPGALPFPFYNIEEMADRLPRDGTWIIAYCACPHAASGHVVDELRQRGFRHTAVLDEGISYWTTRHYPMAQAVQVTP